MEFRAICISLWLGVPSHLISSFCLRTGKKKTERKRIRDEIRLEEFLNKKLEASSMQSMSAIAGPESPAPSPIENIPAHEIAENEPQNFAEENLTLNESQA